MFGVLINPEKDNLNLFLRCMGAFLVQDFYGISKKDTYRVEDSKIEPVTISDHSLVKLEICLGSDEYLTDPVLHQERQKDLIDSLSLNDGESVSLSILWEGAKAVMRGNIIFGSSYHVGPSHPSILLSAGAAPSFTSVFFHAYVRKAATPVLCFDTELIGNLG